MSRQEWIGAGLGVAAICVTIGVSSGSTNARIDDLRSDMRADIQDIRADLRELRNDVDDLRGDVSDLSTDVNDLRNNVNGLRADVNRTNRSLVEHITGPGHGSG